MSPYDGTAGYSGTDTSEERARREVENGSLSFRLHEVKMLLVRRGFHGATSSEVEDQLRIHHGQASSALTNLHKSGLIARTAHRRDGSKVYKDPSYLLPHDRLETYVPRGQKQADRIAELEDVIARARMAILTGEPALAILEGRS